MSRVRPATAAWRAPPGPAEVDQQDRPVARRRRWSRTPWCRRRPSRRRPARTVGAEPGGLAGRPRLRLAAPGDPDLPALDDPRGTSAPSAAGRRQGVEQHQRVGVPLPAAGERHVGLGQLLGHHPEREESPASGRARGRRARGGRSARGARPRKGRRSPRPGRSRCGRTPAARGANLSRARTAIRSTRACGSGARSSFMRGLPRRSGGPSDEARAGMLAQAAAPSPRTRRTARSPGIGRPVIIWNCRWASTSRTSRPSMATPPRAAVAIISGVGAAP